jgi:CYTH domain-containing protein
VEERKYPVDYTTTRSTFYTVNITLPEGYVVDETPLPIRIGLPEKSATVLYNVSAIGNRISIMFKLDINKPVFLVDEYQLLKEFYSQIIEKLRSNYN